MKKLKFFVAAGLLTAVAIAPSLAEARHHHRYFRANPLPYPISYLHNYGPGAVPGTFAYYDGPATVNAIKAPPPISARTAADTPASEPLLVGFLPVLISDRTAARSSTG